MEIETQRGMGGDGIERDRQAIPRLLGELLADEFVLYAKVLNYRWNMGGRYFAAFDDIMVRQCAQLDQIATEVAVHVRALGHVPITSLRGLHDNPRLDEVHGRTFPADRMLEGLLHDHEAVIWTLRRDLEVCARLSKADTHDFLSRLLEKHEAAASMLRGQLAGTKAGADCAAPKRSMHLAWARVPGSRGPLRHIRRTVTLAGRNR